MRRPVSAFLKNAILCLVSLTMLVPMAMIVLNSFKDKVQSTAMGLDLPTVWHPENYLVVIEQGKLLQSFFNSLTYACSAVLIGLLLAAPAAFALSRCRTRLYRVLYYVIILGIATPINFVALMKVMQTLHLINSRLGLSLLYAAIQIPFTVFLIYGFINGIPVSMDEAGIIDGCKPPRLFFSVILPMLKPVIITVMILNFLNTWNEFILPLYYMSRSTTWPMTLSIYNFFGMYKAEWNLVCADIVLTSLPVVIVYLLGQKHIISGMTAGAVKG